MPWLAAAGLWRTMVQGDGHGERLVDGDGVAVVHAIAEAGGQALGSLRLKRPAHRNATSSGTGGVDAVGQGKVETEAHDADHHAGFGDPGCAGGE